jgi:hypothetical protein
VGFSSRQKASASSAASIAATNVGQRTFIATLKPLATLGQTAKSPNQMNRNHPDMIFRVRVEGLKPKSTYFYIVESTQATGQSDGVKSPVRHFSTP